MTSYLSAQSPLLDNAGMMADLQESNSSIFVATRNCGHRELGKDDTNKRQSVDPSKIVQSTINRGAEQSCLTVMPKDYFIKDLKIDVTYKTDGQLGGRSGVPPART